MSDNLDRLEQTEQELARLSPSACLAKWYQTTLYLGTGYGHSCHHPAPQKIPLAEISEKPSALHNTRHKKFMMQQMIDGKRPEECSYCWRAEDLGHRSDRVYKSSNSWAYRPFFAQGGELTTEDVDPSYLEVSFSNTCNFKCVYCSPDVSSSWMREIEEHGAVPTSLNYNNLEYLELNDRMPVSPNRKNPYVDAFWQWWPTLYPQLHTLRLTGGEPLLSRDVWQVIDNLIENPNPELLFAINTNLCVQDELIDKLIMKLNQLQVREIQVFTSNEATGAQAEYIRSGLEYAKWCRNVERILAECPNVMVSFMTTVNVLSIPTFSLFIEQILMWRQQRGFSRVQFSVNYLRYPVFLDLRTLTPELKSIFKRTIDVYTQQAVEPHEREQISRLIAYTLSDMEPEVLSTARQDFAILVDTLDARRNTRFLSVFPELTDFYTLCKT